MQYVNALVSLNGDVANQMFRPDISVAELELLRRVHGEMSVSEIRFVRKQRVNHFDEMDRLKQAYPFQEERILELSRDFGGKLPTDLRDLRIDSQLFARDPVTAVDAVDLGKKLAEAEEEELEEEEEED